MDYETLKIYPEKKNIEGFYVLIFPRLSIGQIPQIIEQS